MNLIGKVASMTHGRTMTKAMPLLIGAGLLLSACAANSDYGPPPSAYNDPVYGTVDFDYGDWGGWGGYHGYHGWRGHSIGGHPHTGWTGGGGGGGHGGRHG
jgi:hypothetical protein